MGNITYIIPTENLQDFNFEKVCSLIREEFPHFSVDDGVVNMGKNKDCYITDFWIDDDCYLLEDPAEDLKNLREMDMEDLVIDYNYLLSLNLDLNKAIATKYGGWFIEKNSIDMFLKDHFKGYVFDEGIHPEFIPPNYVSKNTLRYIEENSFKNKFKNFIKNLKGN